MKYENITVIIVCYNTPNIITNAVDSIIEYVNELIIVDNSDKKNDAYFECDILYQKYDNLKVIHTEKNIGHGPGLNLGVKNVNTEYFICMDSDAKLLDNNLLEEMIKTLEKDKNVYGCGKIIKQYVNLNGKIKKIDYLYLPFCMINKNNFLNNKSFIHGGAPFIETMKNIYKKMKLIQIKDFDKKILHEGRQTRKIAGYWRKSFGGRKGV